MAENGQGARRNELKELVYVAHSDPKAFIDSLTPQIEAIDGWLGIAAELGDEKAVKKMKRDAMARRYLEKIERNK